jgi:hypothetical protein
MTDIELQRLIDRCHFRRATSPEYRSKAMAHEYVVPDRQPDTVPLSQAMRRRIEEAGYDAKFFRRSFRYYNFNGWKYWFCENILNRCPLKGYDAVDQT